MSDGLQTLPRGRLIAFLLLLAFMVLGPFYRQVLHGHNKWIRNWVMFSGVSDICAAHYELHESDGSSTPLDRYEILGVPRTGKEAKSVKFLGDADQVRAMGRRLCRALPAGSDVRVYARCATGTGKGWKTVVKADEDLCSTPPPKKANKKKSP